MAQTKTLLVVAGPTAVGKTALAMQLAATFRTDIVSADSRQIYKELEIGTAKPTLEELSRVKHHFVNCMSITEAFDAGRYGREARQVLDTLFLTRDVIVLCGGSGLYIKALLEGFDALPEVPAEVRNRIRDDYEKKGLDWLQREIAILDPDYFEAVDRFNPQRLMRAMEVILATGKTFSGYHAKEKLDLPFQVIKIGLEMAREELYKRIDERMDRMIEQGLFEEAENFFPQQQLNALQTVGYQEVFGFLEGKFDKAEAIRLMKRNSRRYAKRQLTWFRKDKEFRWFDPQDWTGIMKYIGEVRNK